MAKEMTGAMDDIVDHIHREGVLVDLNPSDGPVHSSQKIVVDDHHLWRAGKERSQHPG